MNDFKHRLKGFFQSSGTLQKHLASLVGVSEVTVSNWVKGKAYPRKKMKRRVERIIDNYMESIYPTYYSWCCSAVAECVFVCNEDSGMREGTCTKCWKLDYVSVKKKEKRNAS